jgi:hypothetical protein
VSNASSSIAVPTATNSASGLVGGGERMKISWGSLLLVELLAGVASLL